jgi:lipopolysaccharide export system permease protein
MARRDRRRMRGRELLDSIFPMRAPRTLVSYVVREVLLYTLLGLGSITVILVTRNLVRALDEVAAAGFQLGDLLTVLSLLGTMLFIYALPIAFLFGILLAIGRMAADVEITAMRACGIGLGTLTLPIVIVGALLSLVTLRLSLDVEPGARREMKLALKEMLARGAAIEPGRFRRIGERLLYVEERDPDQKLRGIVIADRTDPDRPFIVFARSAELRLDHAAGRVLLGLESGDIHVEPTGEDDRYQRIAFDRFDYAIDIDALLEAGYAHRPKEMSLQELRETIRRIESGDTSNLREEPEIYALHLYQRFAAPLAPTMFALVGVPLGMRRTRGARSMGVMWCAALAFLYYLIDASAEFLCLQGWLAPWAAPQLPNLAFAGMGVWLLLRARRSGM